MSAAKEESLHLNFSTIVNQEKSTECPYLDTINRNLLDFDFEKLCSVSLSHLNVYACLVCGKYFQGRNKNSHAFQHSVDMSHHVWINLSTLKFYCLPDNYEIIDIALNDIKQVLKPIFDKKRMDEIDSENKLSRAVDGSTFYAGVIGMNNIRETDYMNVVLHSILFIKPIRNFFLNENNYLCCNAPPGDLLFSLAIRFGELARKIWNPENFKSHVSPHEMIQAVVTVSKKRFQLEKQSDPFLFISWFIDNLHRSLNRDSNKNISVVKNTFRGKIQVFSQRIPTTDNDKEQKKLLLLDEYKPTTSVQPFYLLTLDLPPTPLFSDPLKINIIPQVALLELLCKYNGEQEKEYKTYKELFLKRFIITKLPKYLIIHIKRFSHNYFYQEKNPTLVNFSIKGLDMRDFVHPEFISSHKATTYDLVANISCDQEPGTNNKINYFVHLYHKPTNKWFQIRDLDVLEVMPPMISLSESYIQLWELRK